MKSNPKKTPPAGFALIVTLSLMILLTVIAVGLLTLSSISLRSTARGSAQAIANSNAKLALMLAIGDLQKQLGPDQRISANAGALDGSSPRPNVVGVWDGYGWLPGSPDTVPSPSAKEGKFRRWLVSAKDPDSLASLSFVSSTESSDSIWLTNPETVGTLGSNSPRMRADRIDISAGKNRGGLAYMVSDNSTKASLGTEGTSGLTADQRASVAQNVAHRTAATGPRPDVLDKAFQKISGPPEDEGITDPSKIITLPTAVLAVGEENREQVTGRTQSLTTNSLGLLTDPVVGGLKTDLTPYMEGTENLSRTLGQTPYYSTIDGAPSWDYLRSHYQLYRERVVNQANGTPRVTPNSTDLTTGAGIQPRPRAEILLPVIAKLQIMFSLVSHHAHISERVQAFNSQAQPPGNQNHAVPHLVYDPFVTLYNPYDVELDLSKLRIQISDPPVGFQFQKHDNARGTHPWYRDEFGKGEFHGLARFQIASERDPNARRFFILYLSGKKGGTNTPGGRISLLPGEVKVFSPWVEENWTWGLETAGGYTPRAFFDWDASQQFGTRDGRTKNAFGVETIPGVDFRAGLQADHLSYGGGRPAGLDYPWQTGNGNLGGGWVSLKTTDDITVNAKPMRTVTSAALPDFRVDILAGVNTAVNGDILRTFEFRMADPATEMSVTGSPSGVITRFFKNASLLQEPSDPTPGGKSPFAIFTMSAKTTQDVHDDSKSWAFNNPVVHGASQDSTIIGNAVQSYDLRLQEVQDYNVFPGIEYDSLTDRGYFGAAARVSQGVSVVPMFRVPLTPAASLGDWIGANLIMSSQFPRVNYALGNSFANPLIPSNAFATSSPINSRISMLDHSWLMNSAMWDRYYFSSATNYGAGFKSARQKAVVLEDFFTGRQRMINGALIPYIAGSGEPTSVAAQYAGEADADFAAKFAANAMIEGAFNINSDSVDAWRAVLSSLRDSSVTGYTSEEYPMKDKTAFVRNGLPVAGSSDDASPQNSVNALGQIRWAGFRSLNDAQITSLATAIVTEIRARGGEDGAPSLSVADFVNRRLGSPKQIHALRGILQTAIDNSGINTKNRDLDSNLINGSSLAANRTKGLNNVSALDGYTADGAAPMLSQGDILTGLAPIITARGDTFTIRSYGEARNNTGKVVEARAWCEATVQRVPEYVDPTDAPEVTPDRLNPSNAIFGRRFVVTSFRWLNASEI